MNVQEIVVGKVVEQFKRPDGMVFDLDDTGGMIVAFFSNPSQHEIDQFKAGKNFEMRFVELQNVIMFTFKIGDLNWMDAPYTPHLSPNLTTLNVPESGQGLATTLVLADGNTGEVKSLRLIGLSDKFTNSLFAAVTKQMSQPFSLGRWNADINSVFGRYSTEQLVQLSKNYFRI